ncbi:ADA regulatory protein / Methylated-DNA--protein-cysteine methyltransferase [Minicystis rosea]|nr:ADA regulatory protein / Methylated-DNA--protein-cysteine methyltransferase [Minicystis rosea]
MSALMPTPALEADDRWRAIVARDRAADGAFVYAVRTTGIYCRPSCASRQPRRENVTFFATPAEAVSAGFRACRRCRPADGDPRRDVARVVVVACRHLEREAVTTRRLAEDASLSVAQFLRLFRAHTGVSPQAWRRRVLAERARETLPEAPSVLEAVFAAGYASSSRFYEGIGRELGMGPAEARAGARGRAVCYATRASSLGEVLVAWTERGVCDVALGDDAAEMIAALRTRLPNAALAERALPPWLDDVLAVVDRGHAREVPLDIQGTAFQERVWAALRRIPAGETRTYQEIAASIGAPKATRAVARACASNRIAVLVPCHRVVRSDGDPSGYRWGPQRKRALIDRER